MSQRLLSVTGISKSFPGVRALDNVHFELQSGEVHALIGENGAGKSTLIKIISGIHQPDSGTLNFRGQQVNITNPAHAQSLGISTVPQEPNLEPYLSAAENIFLGRQATNRLGLIQYGKMYQDAKRLLDDLGIDLDPRVTVNTLTLAEKQMVSIARAVSIEAQILILDEPTSALTDRETELLFKIVRRLQERGLGIIYISHRLEEIFELCDRVTVLRDGQFIDTRLVSEVDRNQIISMMIGRDVGDLYRKDDVTIGAPVLEVRNLTKHGILRDISFTLHRGEIVGLAGLVGAGRTDLAAALFGEKPFDEGEVLLEGTPIRPKRPRDAIRMGIGLVPEDRKEQGLVLDFSVTRNVSLAHLPNLTRFDLIDGKKERQLADEYVERLAIKTPSIGQKVAYLSGGNQQKVVISKWLATNPKVLIVDEPTRGIDVGAKANIYELLSELARQGMAILMISSDLPEILAMSDRILVMRQGRISAEIAGDEATQEKIMEYAVV